MNIIDNQTLALVTLSHFQKFGPASLKKINENFDNLEEVFRAPLESLLHIGITQKTAEEFISQRSILNTEKILAKMATEQISAILIGDKDYPAILTKIFDAPQLLYYKGDIRNITNCLAIVGSRKHTSYGARVTESIAGELAANGFTIISGLALGVDTIAHQAALKAKGRTIAVLGTGLDNKSLYPPTNRKLADDIVANGGAIISEFPLGTEPLRYNFPMRNRIVSGLSLGTVVVEASEKSGSLITASCALEQGREVFAVPGNIFSDFSKGTNNLIKQGAKTVSSAQEIIETFDFQYEARHTALKKAVPASAEEEKIIAIIGCETRHINDIVRLSDLDTSRINSTLIIMEMKGMVRNIGGGEYIIT